MTTSIESATTLRAPGIEFEFDEAQRAAVSFLARYSGRTLDAYRHDQRGSFQWATDHGIAVLEASRARRPRTAGYTGDPWRASDRRSRVGVMVRP